MKVDIIAKSDHAYLVPARSSEGNYLIVPTAHTESLQDLPDTWWHEVTELLPHVPDLPVHYNLSVNIGRNAGQTVKHVHFWVTPRAGGASAGKGLARLVSEANRAIK